MNKNTKKYTKKVQNGQKISKKVPNARFGEFFYSPKKCAIWRTARFGDARFGGRDCIYI